MKNLKRAVIDGMFPDVKGCPRMTASGEGVSKTTAISRAVFNLCQNSRARGKQWHQLKMSVVVFDVERPDAADEQKDQQAAPSVPAPFRGKGARGKTAA